MLPGNTPKNTPFCYFTRNLPPRCGLAVFKRATEQFVESINTKKRRVSALRGGAWHFPSTSHYICCQWEGQPTDGGVSPSALDAAEGHSVRGGSAVCVLRPISALPGSLQVRLATPISTHHHHRLQPASRPIFISAGFIARPPLCRCLLLRCSRRSLCGTLLCRVSRFTRLNSSCL